MGTVARPAKREAEYEGDLWLVARLPCKAGLLCCPTSAEGLVELDDGHQMESVGSG